MASKRFSVEKIAEYTDLSEYYMTILSVFSK